MIRKAINFTIKFIFQIFLFFLFNTCWANIIEIKDPTKPFYIGKKASYFEDKSNELKFEEIIKKEFKPLNQEVPNLGHNPSTFWLKFKVKNISNYEKLILELEQPIIDEVILYSQLSSNKFLIQSLGENKPFSQRKYNHPNYLFDIYIPKDSTSTFFLKVRSREQIVLPIKIGELQTIWEELNTKDVLFGIYFGVFIVMILYNLFIYFSIKDPAYLYYVFYVITVAFTQCCVQGYSFKYLWPNSPWLAQYGMLLAPALVGFAGIEFAKKFLNSKKLAPQLHKLSFVFLAIYFLCLILPFTNFHNYGYFLVEINAFLVSIFLMTMAVVVYRNGNSSAIYFIIAWSIFLVGVCIYVLKDFDILPYNTITYYTMPFGSAIETVLLSFALADRINILKKENEEKQNEIIKHLKSNEEYLLAWKEASINAERLKRENIIVEFESLKNQVNPHFLFNSLSVLTELLYLDQDQAAEFVRELARVYRYVLDNKNKELIKLNTELEFITSFVHLLKIRFDKNLFFNNKLPTDSDILIAPLTLQLLIENAIKHNVISEDDPLTIHLYIEKYFIVITNNIHLKSSPITPSGIGLKNIQERYNFLTKEKVVIINDGITFTVKVPIILKNKSIFTGDSDL